MAADNDRLKPGGDAAEAIKECDAFEEEVAALKLAYDQFFMGLEKKPPAREHEELKKRLNQFRLRPHRAVAVKFRVGSLHQKFQTYERLWERTLKEMENGTYTRDVLRARKKQQAAESQRRKGPEVLQAGEDSLEEVMAAAAAAVDPRGRLGALPKVPGMVGGLPKVPPVTGSLPAVAPVGGLPKVPPVTGSLPPVSQAGAPRASAAPSKGGADLSDSRMRAVYDAYVAAKRKGGEDTSKLTYEAVAQTLRKQVPELLEKTKAKGVDFKVVVQDGKAQLKAVPKE